MKENQVGPTIDESEVVTRIYFVLNNFGAYDLNSFDFSKSFENQGIDSLEQIAIITSIEHEFHTVFADHVFDSFQNMNDIKKNLVSDYHTF